MFFRKPRFLNFKPKLPKLKGTKPYIMPTGYGLAFLFLIVDIFALSYARSTAPFHTVGLTLIVFGLVAMIQTNSNLQNILIDVDRCDLGEAGARAEIQISLRNAAATPSYNIQVQVDKPFALDQNLVLDELSFPTHLPMSVQCPKRGVYALGRIKIFSRGVYGLFYTWRWQDVDNELIVYPAPKGTLPLPGGSEGAAKRSLNNEDFVGHKPFLAGDSLRHIDWKAYARGSELLVKDYADQALEALELRWVDTSGPTETRLEQLCAWVILMSSNQRPYSLHLPNSVIERGMGVQHDRLALHALAAFKES